MNLIFDWNFLLKITFLLGIHSLLQYLDLIRFRPALDIEEPPKKTIFGHSWQKWSKLLDFSDCYSIFSSYFENQIVNTVIDILKSVLKARCSDVMLKFKKIYNFKYQKYFFKKVLWLRRFLNYIHYWIRGPKRSEKGLEIRKKRAKYVKKRKIFSIICNVLEMIISKYWYDFWKFLNSSLLFKLFNKRVYNHKFFPIKNKIVVTWSKNLMPYISSKNII